MVADYADSIPKWVLCGRSAKVAGVCKVDVESYKKRMLETPAPTSASAPESTEEYPHWTMPEPTISDGYAGELNSDFLPLGFAIPHVAPDDPCPCGSGLRYCRCHGRYLS